jgi:hypothetical protein
MVVYIGVELLLAEDTTANKGKLKSSINDLQNLNIVFKTAVEIHRVSLQQGMMQIALQLTSVTVFLLLVQ